MEGAPTRRIIEVVNKCPTQALEWKYNREMDQKELQLNQLRGDEETPKTLQEEENQRPVKVSLMKNGPIVVEGDFKVIGADGNTLRSMLMTSFCRCGSSKSMPYCDGTHRKIGFIEKDD